MVLTGDIGRAVERDVAAAIPPARLRVVKIPHHGSLTSSTPEFVRSAAPARRRRQRRPQQPLRPPGAGGAGALPSDRRGDLPNRPGRRGDGRDRRLLARCATRSRADASCANATTKHEDTKTHEEHEEEVVMLRVPTRSRMNRKAGPRHDRMLHRRASRRSVLAAARSIYSTRRRIELNAQRNCFRAREAIPGVYRGELLCHQHLDFRRR